LPSQGVIRNSCSALCFLKQAHHRNHWGDIDQGKVFCGGVRGGGSSRFRPSHADPTRLRMSASDHVENSFDLFVHRHWLHC
jgi:hypothetical protein